MFKSQWLERLSHVHPIVPLLIWVPISLFVLAMGIEHAVLSPLELAAWAATGVLSWTLVEYVLHRYVFHLQIDSHWGRRFHFLLHGVHHDDPNDPSRLVMPPAASFILALILIPIFRLIFGPEIYLPFLAGFIWGYLAYDYIHFAVHHFTPRTPVGKFLKQSHMLHHFTEVESRWGVSSPLWDYVFGTTGRSKKKKRSA